MKAKFTLVELLVVISIIAILSGLLLPVIHLARKCARKSGCVSNIKQLTIAAVMYADQNNGRLPREDRNIPEDLFKPDYFRGDSFELMGLPESVYKCPANPIMKQVPGANHGSEYELGILNWQTSYFYLADSDRAGTSSWVKPCKWKRRPWNLRWGKLALFTDIVEYHTRDGWIINHQTKCGRKDKRIIPEGANISFVDCHAAWKRKDYFPNELETDPEPYGNATAVHNPNKLQFAHKYWW